MSWEGLGRGGGLGEGKDGEGGNDGRWHRGCWGLGLAFGCPLGKEGRVKSGRIQGEGGREGGSEDGFMRDDAGVGVGIAERVEVMAMLEDGFGRAEEGWCSGWMGTGWCGKRWWRQSRSGQGSEERRD